MFTRKLGRSEIKISPMGMGCWAIGGPFWSGETPLGWGKVDDEESIRAIHTALEMGITFLIRPTFTGPDTVKKILAKALDEKRKEVIIASKFSNVFDEDSKQVSGSDASPAFIRQACEASLRRLNTDYLDLYQFHDNGFPAEDAGPVRDTLEELVAEGKIRAYGWSTDFLDRAEVFAHGKNCSSIQFQQNVLDDNFEMISFCEKHNLAAINRGPLAMGLLTEKYNANTRPANDDVRGEKSPEWMKYFKNGKPNPEWLKKTKAVREILSSEGRTLAQGALAWLWGRSEQTIPIPGFRTVKQVSENCAAIQFGPLTKKQMQEINNILRS